MTRRALVWLGALASPFGTLGCVGSGEPPPQPAAVAAELEQAESAAQRAAS